MAQFRGTIQGGRGEASRLGTKSSGLTTKAAGWRGGIETRLWHDKGTGLDMFEVRQVSHHGAGITRTIAHGVVGGNVTLHGPGGVQQSLIADEHAAGGIPTDGADDSKPFDGRPVAASISERFN